MRDWKKYVDQYEPSDSLKDEVAALRVCQLAAMAAELGTYAVGAVLLDDKGEVLADGHNKTFVDGFRSDLHAEMVVLTKFETEHQMPQKPGTLTLISSLEPCQTGPLTGPGYAGTLFPGGSPDYRIESDFR